MATRKKIEKIEISSKNLALVKKYWSLVDVMALSKKCDVSRHLIYMVAKDERKDHHNIMHNAYLQIKDFMK